MNKDIKNPVAAGPSDKADGYDRKYVSISMLNYKLSDNQQLTCYQTKYRHYKKSIEINFKHKTIKTMEKTQKRTLEIIQTKKPRN